MHWELHAHDESMFCAALLSAAVIFSWSCCESDQLTNFIEKSESVSL